MEEETRALRWRRLAWFFGIWAASVAALAAVAYGIRLAIGPSH